MDYQSHYYHTQSAPPNVNGNFCASNGGLDANGGGRHVSCAIDDYTNLMPSYYTFDLSLGYNTMDMPANEYSAKHRRSAGDPEHHWIATAPTLPDQHRRRQSVYLRSKQESAGAARYR